MKKTILTLSGCLLVAGAAQAQVLLSDHFDNGTPGTDVNGTNGGFSGVEVGGPNTGFTTTESGTAITHTSTGTNNQSGIFSNNSFDPTAYSGFTATWVVNSYQDPAGAGFNLVVTSAASLTAPQVLFQFEQGNNAEFKLIADDGTDSATMVTDAITVGQARDGFTFSATFDASGISYTVTDLATLDDSVGTIAYGTGLSYGDLFDSTTHIGAYTQATGTTNTNFIIDQISVTAVPELGTYALFAGLFGLSYVMLRRREA